MRYIIITGVNFDNKGAEAMMFHLYHYLQYKWRRKKVIVFCKNSEKQLEEYRKRYNLRIISCYLADAFYAEGGIYRLAGKIKGIQSRSNSAKIRKILQNADLCVDASGFNFSSKFSFMDNYAWLKNIEIMKNHNIPVVVMPQSFGPFAFPKWYGWILRFKAQQIMQYPSRIFAREQSGFYELKTYCNVKNLLLSLDLVLLGERLNPNNFYRNSSLMKKYKIADGSVAVIPNQKLKVHSTDLNGEKIYISAIQALIKEGKKVYIVRHCESDRQFCKSLAKKFRYIENVRYIDDDIDCLEFAELIKHFEFAIASRYHGIVHSYKAGIPCVVIGWADKYLDLAQQMFQDYYVLDLSDYNEDKLKMKIHEMSLNYLSERTKIIQRYNQLKKTHKLYEIAFDDVD